jgi:hypothetical protein
MKIGCVIAKTANEWLIDARDNFVSEFSPTATIDSNGVIHFGKWAVEPNGDMVYDNWYNIECHRLSEEDWICHMFSKAWIDWNEFIPAYWHALQITKKTHIKTRVYYL